MGRKKRLKNKKSQKETCSYFSAEKLSSLSNVDYSVYYILYNSEKIGYLGVFRNGKFNHSIIQDDVDESNFLSFCSSFIQEELKLSPFPAKKKNLIDF